MGPEERLIVELTGEIGRSSPPPAAGADWRRVLRLARANRLVGAVFDGLDRAGLLSELPEDVRKGFEGDYFQQVAGIRSALDLAAGLAGSFSAAGVELVILRGPALGLTVYPRPFLRPFSDLDLLVGREDLPRARQLLEAAGLRPPPGTFPDRYFERWHLHLPYNHPETGLPVELHWALDHPYTLSLIEYRELFAKSRTVRFEGQPIPVLAPEDRVLTLALHLVKHCPFLPELLEEDDLPSILLRGRWLLWVLDLRRAIVPAGEQLDWEAIAEKARRRHLERETSAALAAVAAVYGSLPDGVSFPPPRPGRRGRLRKELYLRQLRYLDDRPRSGRLTRKLFGLQAESVFRPVRILDLSGYLFPGGRWLEKRYRVRGPAVIPAAAYHAARGLVRLAGNLLDYLYYRFRPW